MARDPNVKPVEMERRRGERRSINIPVSYDRRTSERRIPVVRK